MGACVSTLDRTSPAGRTIRVLRWTFRRADETAVCELGLDSDESAYELRLDLPDDVRGKAVERFADAMDAFERQTAVERQLIARGWSLDAFHTDRRDL